ncbi:MAG: PAS domain S-box protein [Atribacterota bacterium]
MRDRDKDKERLLNELMELRKKIVGLDEIKNSPKSTEKQLKKSEQLYNSIFKNSSDIIGITTFSLNLVYIYINPSIKSIGYKQEELLGKSPFDFIHPDDRKKLFPLLKKYMNAKVKKLLTGKESTITERIEYRFKDKDGNWRNFQTTGNIVGDQLLFITRDITRQKKLEEALRKSQQEFASLFKGSPEALVYTDEKSNILDINPRFTELFGYTLEEIKGKNIDDGMIHPPDKIEEGKELGRIAKSEGYFKYETIRKKKNGPLFPVSIYGSNISIDGQLKGMLVIYIDTTEHQNMLDKLKKSEEKYRNLFENMPGAYYRTDREGNLIMINPEGAKLFGYNSLKNILGKNIAQHLYFAPEERKNYLKELEKNKGNLKDFELTLKKKNGTLLVISDTSHFYYDIEENLAGVEGIFVDITGRKQNEKMQKVLYNISQAANSPISLKQLYKAIHKELGTIIDTTNFYIALVDEKEDKIYFPYHQDEKDDDFPIAKFSTTNTLTAYVIKTGKSLLNNSNQYKEMADQGILTPMGTTTGKSIWLGVPLKIEDKTIGAIIVQSYTNPNLYSEDDIKFIEFVSSQVATAIERKSSEEKIKHLSFHDALTGLYNRAYFEEELERYNFPRYYPLSIVMLDVNGLKVINDTFGHHEGDRLLKHLSQTLTSVSRQGDILARIGGDEFAILLPSTTSEEAHNFCERIKKACQQDKIEPIYLRLNISLGHATQEGEYKDINSLLKAADRNMYQDKLFNGKSREKHFLEAFRIVLAERDPHTTDHAQRLQELALSLGQRVGLSEYQLGKLKLLALLHDMGKIGIPDSILFKTYILTPSEWRKMREHSRIGYRMARNIPDFAPIAQEILYHHEHWDGTGYPEGLKGEKIPFLSRIISIVDTYDVMQSRRPYKGPISKTKALKEIKRCAGTQFDPQLVEIFLKIVKNSASREKK